MHYIYVIQNQKTLKVYVGLSKNPDRRWYGHRSDASSGKRKNRLYDSIRSHGIESFTFQVIENHEDPNECAEAEMFWIAFFRSWDPQHGYNLNFGGTLGLPTIETRLKMSESAKRRGPNNKGQRFSIEACANIRKGQLKRGESWKKNVQLAAQNRSESWRQNISRAAKAREERKRQAKITTVEG